MTTQPDAREPDQALTADTITDDQIQQLSREAAAAGDLGMVATCQYALADASDYAGLTGDEDLEADVAPSILRARQRCAEVINSARAMVE